MTTPHPLDAAIETIRVIAHPARIQLYELLVLHGPRNVSWLAERSGLAVGSASYHLHQLHAAGYVAEADGTDRRSHLWKAVPGGLRWSPADYLDTASARAISTSAQRMMTERRIRRLSHWLATWQNWDKAWVDAALESDAVLRLTSAELREYTSELEALTHKWAARAEEAAETADGGSSVAGDGREAVFVMHAAFPMEAEE